jgi:DNA polymerase-3 subunit delta
MPESIPPVQLFLGPEEGQKTEAVEKFTSLIASRHGEPPEVHRFYAFESRMNQILTVLRNGSLFARHRLVIVGSAEAIKRKEDVEACVEYIKSPAPDASLLLISSELTKEMDKKIVAAVPKDRQKIFWEMFDNQKSGWIVNFFRKHRITVQQEAVGYILEMVENNTRDLRTECERLALFFGPDVKVELESVEQYLYHGKEENVFTLFDQISSRHFLPAEEILEKISLSRDTEATQLVSGLQWQFRRLAALKRLMDENYEAAEAFAKTGLTTKKAQRTYLEGSRNYSWDEIKAVILLLAEFDSRFRSVKGDLHALLLQLLVYYIVVGGGRGAWRWGV